MALVATACGPRFDRSALTGSGQALAGGDGGAAASQQPQAIPTTTAGPAVPAAPRGKTTHTVIHDVVVRGGTIKVGGIFPLTGGLSELGKPAFQGAQAYFNYLNAHGGISGRKIQFVACDDQADDTKSATCTKKLVEQDGVFVMGPSFTPFSLTPISQLQKAGVPWVGYDGINIEGFDADNIVTVGAPIETMAHALIPYWYDKMTKAHGAPPRKIGAVVLDSGPAQTYLREVKNVICPKLGCSIVHENPVSLTSSGNYPGICAAMHNAAVDTIWIVTDPASAIQVMAECHRLGDDPPYGYLGQHGVYINLTLRQTGRAADGLIANSALLPATVAAPATAEMQRIITTYYPDADLGYFTELAYASARMVADTIAKALATGGEVSRSGVLKAASATTTYDCHGLCRNVDLAPPVSKTGGNHNVWIVRADFSRSSDGEWLEDAGPIDAYTVRTWPCPGRPC